MKKKKDPERNLRQSEEPETSATEGAAKEWEKRRRFWKRYGYGYSTQRAWQWLKRYIMAVAHLYNITIFPATADNYTLLPLNLSLIFFYFVNVFFFFGRSNVC